MNLSWSEESRSRIGGWLDQLALRGMSRAFDTTLMPSAEDLGAIRQSSRPYMTDALRTDPRAFFAFLETPLARPEVRSRDRRLIAGGAVTRHALASDYEPFDATVPCAPSNAWMPIEHWRHDAPAPATVLAVHGFTMGDPSIDAVALMANEWFALGVDVVLMTLPFHGARTPPNARYSGELFASWHVGRLNEAVRQSIYDLRNVTTWLRRETTAPVGVVGMSLGGYLAALLAALSDDLAFVIPIAAPVRLGTFPTTLFAQSRYAGRAAPPFTPAELDEAYHAHSPLTHPLALPHERVMIVAGRGDRIVPPEHALELWSHWGRPDIHWYGGSHVTPFRRAAVFAAGARHLQRLGLVS
jgi:esterase/lipase